MIRKSGEGLLSAEELATMRVGYACELVRGRIVRLTPAGMIHGEIVRRTIRLVDRHAEREKLGGVTSGDSGFYVHRKPDSVRAPDVAFISNATQARFETERGTFYPSAPDLAIEVLSPDDRWGDVREKVDEYLGAGAKAVWVLSPPDETIHIFEAGAAERVLGAKDELTGGVALPGFKARVSAFFTDKPKS